MRSLILFLLFAVPAIAADPVAIRLPEVVAPPTPMPQPAAAVLGDVCPSLTIYDFANSCSCKVHLLRDLILSNGSGCVQVANLFDNDRCQLCPSDSFATGRSFVLVTITSVIFPSIPSKIIQRVVRWVSISVATLHPFGARTKKSEQDETVNEMTSLLVVIASDNDFQMAGVIRRPCTKSHPFLASDWRVLFDPSTSPNASVSTGLIAGEPWNVSILDRNLVFSHDVSSFKRGCYLVRAGECY